MNFWLIACINFGGISGIVGIIYLTIWLLSKRKDSFKLHPNPMLLGALISYSISLTIITTGICLAIPQDIFWGVLIMIFCAILVLAPVAVFFAFIVFYLNSTAVDENSVQVL